MRSVPAPGVERQLRGWPDRAEPGHCQLGAGGRVCLTSFAGADLVADVSGFFPKGSAFTPIPNPRRILDTRPTAGPPASAVPGFDPSYSCDASVMTDINGDGIPDLFAVYRKPRSAGDEIAAALIGNGWHTLDLGADYLLGIDGNSIYKYGPYDPVPGDEVLVGQNLGAHDYAGVVVGWEANGVVTLPDEWDVNAGYLYGDGEQCVPGGVDFIGYTACSPIRPPRRRSSK